MINNYRSIIFDYDDTLVQTRSIRYKTIKTITSEVFNHTISDDEIDFAWGLPADDFLLRIFGRFSDNLEYLWKIYNHYKQFDQNLPHSGAFDFIKKFNDKFLLGILTSSSYKVVLKELEEMNLDLNLFFNIQGAEHTNVHKPNPDVFLPIFQFLSKNGLDKSEILYIGDSPVDFHSSTNFGLNFMGMAHDDRYINFFEEQNIKFVKGFKDLENILNN